MKLGNLVWVSIFKTFLLAFFTCSLILLVFNQGDSLRNIISRFRSGGDSKTVGRGTPNPVAEPRGLPLDSGAFAAGVEPFPSSTAGNGGPIRVIPDASLVLLERAERKLKDPFQFQTTSDGKYLKINFKALSSFPIREGDSNNPKAKTRPQLPVKIRELDRKRVLIVGFMVPLEVDFRTQNVRLFAVSQNMAFCCYGVTPALNELVIVAMKQGKVAEYFDNVPIAVFGDFAVGKQIDGNRMASLYRIAADEVIPVKQFLKREKKTP